MCHHTIGVSSHHERSPHTTRDRHTPQEIATHQPTSTTHTEIGFQNPKISKTYKTYKDQIDRNVFDLENGNQTKAIAIAEVSDRAEPQEQEPPIQPTNTGESRSSAPDGDREILDFIIKTIVRKGVDLANPEAYAKKCLQQNGDHWRSLYAESKRPKQPIKEYTDPYQAESSIAMAIKMGDKDFARGKLENLRQRGEEALADRLLEKFGGALCR